MRERYRQRADVRASVRSTMNERRRELQAWANEEKARRGCQQCGERDPIALDWHHPNGKLSAREGIARMIGDGLGRARLEAAMEMCIVLCANCHRKVHRHEIGKHREKDEPDG